MAATASDREAEEWSARTTGYDAYVWIAWSVLPRWVRSTGREIPVSPIAYDRVFANSVLTWTLTSSEMLRKTDPDQDQTRSLNFTRLLWQREPPEIQRDIRAVDIYRADYTLQAPSDRIPAALVSRTILYTFPLSSID